MAEAFFNKLSEGRHEGISAGSNPASQVNPIVVQAMKEISIDISGNKPKKLNKEMIMAAELAITMGCGEDTCPIVPNELREWDLEDPHDKTINEVRRIRDEIKRRIEALVKELDEKI
jgi:arsenate reductase (thioredoxin)